MVIRSLLLHEVNHLLVPIGFSSIAFYFINYFFQFHFLATMIVFVSLVILSTLIVQHLRIHVMYKGSPHLLGCDTCIITGATQGIGFAIAKLFARDLFNLILIARSMEELNDAKAALLAISPTITVKVIQQDFYLEDAPEQTMVKLNTILGETPTMKIKCLVNNAGICLRGDFLDLSLQDQLSLVQLDATNVLKMCYLVANQWKNQLELASYRNPFRIMNISSFAGVLVSPFMSTYCGAKSFVHMFSMALHDELFTKYNGAITCTSVCPGYTLTPGIYKMKLQHSVAYNANLFEDVDKVAREAYYATMKGQRYTVTGWGNYLISLLAQFVPVWLSSKFVRLSNADVNSLSEAWKTGGPVNVEKKNATVVPSQSRA